MARIQHQRIFLSTWNSLSFMTAVPPSFSCELRTVNGIALLIHRMGELRLMQYISAFFVTLGLQTYTIPVTFFVQDKQNVFGLLLQEGTMHCPWKGPVRPAVLKIRFPPHSVKLVSNPTHKSKLST